MAGSIRFFPIRLSYCGLALIPFGVGLATSPKSAEGPQFSKSASQRKAAVAVQRSIPLLQRTGQSWLDRSSCTSCHHQSLGFVALAVARENGFRIDEAALTKQVRESDRRRDKTTEPMYELTGTINGVSGQGFNMLAKAALKTAPNDFTDSVGFFLTAKQTIKGHWPSTSHRPPLEDSSFTLAANAIRALTVYPYQNGGAAALQRARNWLLTNSPQTAEDRAMRVLGLYWAGIRGAPLTAAQQEVLRQQREDGGWNQTEGRLSDAYATGQALVALRASGAIKSEDQAFIKGANYLTKTQLNDGSWRVPTRRIVEGLPYFETGFPHGKDQFISYAGTAYSTAALALFASKGTTEALVGTTVPNRIRPPATFAADAKNEGLFRAVLAGNASAVRTALQRGANPNARTKSGNTALIMASRSPEMVRLLLDAGANPNLASKLGATPLSVASGTLGAVTSMEHLIAKGADLRKGIVRAKETPIFYSAMSLEPKRIELLLNAGLTLQHDAKYAFFASLVVGDLTTSDYLLKLSPNVNAPDLEYGGNSVNNAVIDRDVARLEFLLRRGGDPNQIDKEGFSPLQVAALSDPDHWRMVKMLLDAGADPKHRTKDRAEAHVLAAKAGNKRSAELLAEAFRRASTVAQK